MQADWGHLVASTHLGQRGGARWGGVEWNRVGRRWGWQNEWGMEFWIRTFPILPQSCHCHDSTGFVKTLPNCAIKIIQSFWKNYIKVVHVKCLHQSGSTTGMPSIFFWSAKGNQRGLLANLPGKDIPQDRSYHKASHSVLMCSSHSCLCLMGSFSHSLNKQATSPCSNAAVPMWHSGGLFQTREHLLSCPRVILCWPDGSTLACASSIVGARLHEPRLVNWGQEMGWDIPALIQPSSPSHALRTSGIYILLIITNVITAIVSTSSLG